MDNSRWPQLTSEILVAIAERLTLPEDFTALRGVCTAWRNAVTRDHFTGDCRVLLLIPAREGEQITCRIPYSRISTKTVMPDDMLSEMMVIGVGFGWLLVVENDGEAHMWSPITGRVIHLPNFHDFPGGFSPSYSIRGALSDQPSADLSGFELAVILNRRLGFWKPIFPKWTSALDLTGLRLAQIITDNLCYHSGTLYLVDQQGRIIAWNPDVYENHISPVVEVNDRRLIENRTMYLVESSRGELLLITRRVLGRRGQKRRTVEFGLVLIDLVRREWNEIHGLRNDAVFIGNNAPITVPAGAALPAVFKGNCIYFTDDNYRSTGRGGDTGVCDLEDESIQRFKISNVLESWIFPPSLWIDVANRFKE